MKENPKMWRNDFPESTNPLRFFLFVSRPHWKPALIAILAVIAASILLTSVAYIFKMITSAVALVPQTHDYTKILLAALLYIVVLFVAQAAFRLSGWMGSYWATGARATARYSLTAYVTLHSRSYFSDKFAGSLANKISHAASGVRSFVEQTLWSFLELFVSVVASFVFAYFAEPALAYMFLVWVSVVLVVNLYFARRRSPLAAHTQQIESKLTGATVDLLSNITAMQEYARRIYEIERLQSINEERRNSGLSNWHFGERILFLNGFLQAVFGGAMAFGAVYYASIGLIAPSDIVLILTIIFRVEGLLLSLGSQLNSVAENWGEVQESLEEILEPHEIPDKAGAIELKTDNASIGFENVLFGFHGHPVFKDFSLSIPKGQRVGLVGRSGAGKSTLIRLLMHHHDIQGGEIKIGGTNIASVTQESLRRAISIVPQEPLLFHRTIRENISYGKPDASEGEIIEAAKRAQAHDFITRLTDGYESLVGERGVKLSGGERQRIAIARAILKNAPILLLDEATSALDSESEVEIQKALLTLMEGKTVIAIAHRLSTLRQMDRIIVLDGGSIEEDGTHDELVERKGTYAELWHHQAGGFLQD
jgi:ATP-binding cassette, subfamily B, bacterial